MVGFYALMEKSKMSQDLETKSMEGWEWEPFRAVKMHGSIGFNVLKDR